MFHKHIFLFLGESGAFFILISFSMKIMLANRIAPDGTPRFAASHLRLVCLPMSHKKDARLIWVKKLISNSFESAAKVWFGMVFV